MWTFDVSFEKEYCSSDCQNAASTPVLITPDFNQLFLVAIDANDLGAGAVVLQEDQKEIEHPFS